MTAHLLNDRFRLAEPAHPGHTILLIDSDRSLMESLGRRLEQQGYQVLSAQSGAVAIEIARTISLHLIVMEQRLADLDALTLCDRLSDDTSTCHIPAIILTHMARPDIIRRSRVAACQYFVRKPCDVKSLLFLIQHAVEETAQVAV